MLLVFSCPLTTHPVCRYWNNSWSQVMPGFEVQGQKSIVIFCSLSISSTFYALKAYSLSFFSISCYQNSVLMCMRKACSPLGHILCYLSVVFHLNFPLFPNHLLHPIAPFWFSSIFSGNLISFLVNHISLWHSPRFICLHLLSLLIFSLI